jgi:hypothetical protein
MQGYDTMIQNWNNLVFVWHSGVCVPLSVHVNRAEYLQGTPKWITQRSDISGDSTVAKRDNCLRSLSHHLGKPILLFVGHCTLDQRDIYLVWKLLHVSKWTKHKLNMLGQFDEPFIKIKKRHMAA